MRVARGTVPLPVGKAKEVSQRLAVELGKANPYLPDHFEPAAAGASLKLPATFEEALVAQLNLLVSSKPTNQAGQDVALYTAHPDDEAMYAGGTMEKLFAQKKDMALVILSHGEGGRAVEKNPDGSYRENRNVPREKLASTRDDETLAAFSGTPLDVSYLFPAKVSVLGAVVSEVLSLGARAATGLCTRRVPCSCDRTARHPVFFRRTSRPRCVRPSGRIRQGHRSTPV